MHKITQPTADSQFKRVVHRLEPGSTLLRVWPLQGGVSAQVTALEFASAGGQTRKVVVRRHGPVDLANNPEIAADEFKLLQGLHALGIAVPRPLLLDRSGEIFPVPYLVVAFVEGTTELAPAQVEDAARQIAAQLGKIHAVDWASLGLAFLPQQAQRFAAMLDKRPARRDDACDEGRIRSVLHGAWPLRPRNAPALLHGDLWPGNLLWQAGSMAAIVDWEDAALGDPLADVANARLELLWAFGVDAMRRFTHEYQALAAIDLAQLPYWELCAALRLATNMAEWAADAHAAQTMRERHCWFVEQAFEQLGAR
jgi:aminoglycoside phosphotransferase (APT) family kinase protein